TDSLPVGLPPEPPVPELELVLDAVDELVVAPPEPTAVLLAVVDPLELVLALVLDVVAPPVPGPLVVGLEAVLLPPVPPAPGVRAVPPGLPQGSIPTPAVAKTQLAAERRRMVSWRDSLQEKTRADQGGRWGGGSRAPATLTAGLGEMEARLVERILELRAP